MSISIETINKGVVEDFGYLAIDTTRVYLGKLSPIPLSQFCQYATESLFTLFNQMRPSEREEMRQAVRQVLDRDEYDQREWSERKLYEGELVEKIMGAIELSNPPQDYLKTPFEIIEGDVFIGRTYLISRKEFTDFVGYILSGGLVGWGVRRKPRYVGESIQKLANLL